jgi:sulfur relay (sulfurtransferase) DsrC/TusE family protein
LKLSKKAWEILTTTFSKVVGKKKIMLSLKTRQLSGSPKGYLEAWEVVSEKVTVFENIRNDDKENAVTEKVTVVTFLRDF